MRPIVFIVFNRPATTQRVFDRIAEARPAKLLIVADGARPDRPGEEELCRQVREIVSAINWPCEVLTNFAPQNLGCGPRIISGLDWAFSIVVEAIILEDDCLPDLSFFPFCHEMLEMYRGDSRIGGVSGTNLVEGYLNTPFSYYFSLLGGIWGWATWKDKWEGYDAQLTHWPSIRDTRALAEVLDRRQDIAYWSNIFEMMYEGRGPNTWDYQWVYWNMFGNRLTIIPSVNLVKNLGFGPAATHTSKSDPRLTPELKTLDFPLKHPSAMVPSRSLDRHFLDLYFPPPTRGALNWLRGTARRAPRAVTRI